MTSPFELWLQRMWQEHVEEVRDGAGRATQLQTTLGNTSGGSAQYIDLGVDFW